MRAVTAVHLGHRYSYLVLHFEYRCLFGHASSLLPLRPHVATGTNHPLAHQRVGNGVNVDEAFMLCQAFAEPLIRLSATVSPHNSRSPYLRCSPVASPSIKASMCPTLSSGAHRGVTKDTSIPTTVLHLSTYRKCEASSQQWRAKTDHPLTPRQVKGTAAIRRARPRGNGNRARHPRGTKKLGLAPLSLVAP